MPGRSRKGKEVKVKRGRDDDGKRFSKGRRADWEVGSSRDFFGLSRLTGSPATAVGSSLYAPTPGVMACC